MKTLFNQSILAAFSFLFMMAMSPANATENPFGMSQANTDMQVASNHDGKCGNSMKEKMKDGKCGDGKCGDGKTRKEGKCGDGKADKEAKCGDGKCGDGKNMKSKCGSE